LLHRPRRQWEALAYVYFEEEPGRRAAAKLLTCDEGLGASRPLETTGGLLWPGADLSAANGYP
jgi:hypothetical protein